MDEGSNMPSSTQEFCLRWNNFHSSLVSAIDGFKNDSFFLDVTLACEGQFMQAHKMLLSACSVFFRDLLKANPCQHPIIILPTDVRFSDLEKMLRFIYQGEVNVQQEHLARFLKTAEMLKIRGLVEDNDKKVIQSCSSPDSNETSTVTDNHLSVIPKRPRLSLEPSTGSSTMHGSNSHGGISDKEELHMSKEADQEYSSDSEMLPVKQEMIELVRECDFGDGFPDEAFLRATATVGGNCDVDASSTAAIFRAAVSAASGGGMGCDTLSSTHPSAPPPPPGTLLPSYVPPAPPQIKSQDGQARSSSQPVGGLIRRFLEECLQLPDPAPLLATYSGLEGTPHFQLLRSVAKEWSYCKNATQNYSSLGGCAKRQRATSRLIETFENIDNLRNKLAHILHGIIVMEVTVTGTIKKVCKAEQNYVQQQQLAQQQQAALQQGNSGETSSAAVNVDVINRDFVIMDIEGVTTDQQEEFKKATEAMKQLRKLFFDQSRRLAVRISQLKKGRQQSHDRMQRHHQLPHHNQQNQQQQSSQGFLQQLQQPQQQNQHLQQQCQQTQHQTSSQQHQMHQHTQQQQQQHHHQNSSSQQQQSMQHHSSHHNQQQGGQHQIQIGPDGSIHLPHHSQLSLHHLHQPWSD